MAYGGTITYAITNFGQEQILKITVPDIDADNDDSSLGTGEPIDLWSTSRILSRVPRQFQWWVSRVSGADDAVSVKLYGKADIATPEGTTFWVELGELTGVAGTNPTTSTLAQDPEIDWSGAGSLPMYRYLKIISTDVGAAGSLTVYIQTIPTHI